jgi:hypothetical protein
LPLLGLSRAVHSTHSSSRLCANNECGRRALTRGFMEHRCGTRYRVDVEVYVHTCQGAVASIGRLTEISVSGGFVKTHLPAHAIALVSLRTRLPGLNRAVPNIQGYVVRRAATGVGIEWLEFAPELVQYLTQHPTICTTEARLRGDRLAAPLMLNSLDSIELPHSAAPRTPRLDERQ